MILGMLGALFLLEEEKRIELDARYMGVTIYVCPFHKVGLSYMCTF